MHAPLAPETTSIQSQAQLCRPIRIRNSGMYINDWNTTKFRCADYFLSELRNSDREHQRLVRDMVRDISDSINEKNLHYMYEQDWEVYR